jgi:hypothetical protein
MIRERALKAMLVVAGLLFLAGIYPLTIFFRSEAALAMMFSLYPYRDRKLPSDNRPLVGTHRARKLSDVPRNSWKPN